MKFNEATTKKQMEVRRVRAKLVKNLDKLERDRLYYLDKAKTAKLRGENESYRLARSGLSATLTQLQRVREMLLNIDITTQMRDMSGTTKVFLEGMDDIFKSLHKINRRTDIKGAQTALRRAMAGMENMQANLDQLLDVTEQSFEDIAQAGAVVTDRELDRLIGRELNLEQDLAADAAEVQAPAPAVAPNRRTAKPSVFRIPEPHFDPAAPDPAEPAGPDGASDFSDITDASAVPAAPAAYKDGLAFDFYPYEYVQPPFSLLNGYAADPVPPGLQEEIAAAAEQVETTLRELGVPASVSDTVIGPQFVRVELSLPSGFSVAKVTPFVHDLSMRLKTDVRIEAPIRGKNAFGVEFANPRRSVVTLRELLEGMRQVQSSGITYCLGADALRQPVCMDLAAAPHMLVAGTTGSGKSCFLHSLILSLMYRYSPAELKLLLIDCKRVEFAAYNGSPFLLTERAVDNETDALAAFDALAALMNERYEKMEQRGARNISEYNEAVPAPLRLPYVVAVADEFADISGAKEYDGLIRSLAQKARAAGIHLVLATQRPSADVISTTVRSNFPVQIAFRLPRDTDSRVALAGESGAEKLLGKGDMLYNDAGTGLCRYQAPLVTQDELIRVNAFIRENTRRVM